MSTPSRPAFDTPNLHDALCRADDATLDALPFGVIAFDAADRVRRYNRTESLFSGLGAESVIGHGVFTVVAPCLDNELVAERFRRAQSAGAALDTTLEYVLTWRMLPTPVLLRLLSSPGQSMRFVLIRHPIRSTGQAVGPDRER